MVIVDGKKRALFLVLILALILSGCAPLFQPAPIATTNSTNSTNGWLAGLRQMVVESCNAQPDPTACRSAWRAAVDATIDPAMQPPVMRRSK